MKQNKKLMINDIVKEPYKWNELKVWMN